MTDLPDPGAGAREPGEHEGERAQRPREPHLPTPSPSPVSSPEPRALGSSPVCPFLPRRHPIITYGSEESNVMKLNPHARDVPHAFYSPDSDATFTPHSRLVYPSMLQLSVAPSSPMHDRKAVPRMLPDWQAPDWV
ncbi:hypothetical protein B7494_g4867 [Chlorociboria aeruginascens]|nr:hypothetical protein B7494_g4867 [Chlorociboria aeruginascens]